MSRMHENTTENDRPMFKKKPGTSGNSGQLYEQKLVMHFLLSGLMAKKDGKIDHFFLGTNVETAGAFDDIVFKYIRGKTTNVVLLQAKHKEKSNAITMAKLMSEKSKRGDFNIDHYFKSYQESKQIFNQTEDLILSGEFENCEFILHTNAIFESKEYSFIYEDDLDDFWKMNDCKRTKFNLNDMFVNASASDVLFKDFLRQFTILFDQPNETQLEDLIKKNIGKYLGVVQEDVRPIYELVIANVQNYWKNEFNYLTECEDYFVNSKKLWELKKEITSNVTLYCNLDITYKCLINLIEIIRNRTLLHITSDEKTKLLHDRQIAQALNEMEFKYIFLNFAKFEEMYDTVFSAFENEYDVLVVSDSVTIDLKKNDIKIKDFIKMYPKKKIIFICKSIETAIEIERIDDMDIKFSNLNHESQKNILDRHILFQGKLVALGAIVLPRLFHTIDGELLSIIASRSRQFEIGKKMQDLGKLKSCHISRKLTRNGIPYEPKDLLDSKGDERNKFILIAGEPGIGKTILLSSLSEKLNCNSSILKWHYRINLVEHSRYFAKTKKPNGLDFLRMACKMEEFENKLFTDYILNEGKVVLFFDGFDEISPKYKDIVIKLLNELVDTKVEKMWVTTRVCLKEELEQRLKTTAYQLEPFSKQDQRSYLQLCGGRTDLQIEEILRIFSESIHEQSGQFGGIPLHLQMLTDIYNQSNEDQEITIFRMYNRFVRKKFFEIQFEEKSGVDINNPALHEIIEDKYEDVIKNYEKFAVLALYEDYLSHLFNDSEIGEIKKALINYVDGGKDTTGIVISIVDGKPIFVHRTFAEFFAATFLVRALEDNKKIDEFLFAIGYFENGQMVMRKFFDFALGDEEEIIVATLKNDYYRIKELTGEFGKRDKGGRTPLHLAAANGFRDIICFLFNEKIEVSPVDKIFGWTPVSYADNIHEIVVMDTLLLANANPKDMFNIIKLVESYPDGDLILLNKILMFHSSCTTFLNEIVKMNNNFVNFEDRFNYNKTPLHYAANIGNLDSIKIMTNVEGCQLKHDRNGLTIFHECVSKGHLHLIEYLTKCWTKCQINSIDIKGRTPLFVAAENGYFDISKLLIERGSTMKENDWEKLLAITKDLGYTSIVELLKSNKDKITKEPAQKESSDAIIIDPVFVTLNELNKAIQINDFNKVEEIISQNINIIDRIISEPDHRDKNEMVLKLLSNTIQWKDMKIFEFLVSKSKKILYLAYDRGATLLHQACSLGNLSIIRFLLSNGSDLKTKDFIGQSCLNYAVKTGHFEVLERFVSSNEDIINDVDNYGHTLLHMAAMFGHKEIAIQLIDKGIELHKQNATGFTFLHNAAKRNHKEFVEHFISSNKELKHVKDFHGNTLLHIAAQYGAIEAVAYLFELNSDLMILNKDGLTPIHISAGFNHLGVTKYFLDQNINLMNARQKDGSTILHVAASAGSLETVVYLLEIGADPSLKDNDEFTCLHTAALNNEPDVLKLFLKTNPELVNSGNIIGYTPLHFAAEFNRVEIAELLLQHEANLLITNNNGSTCLHIAVVHGHLEFVKKFTPLFKILNDPKQLHQLLELAAYYDRLEIFKYLIYEGADPWMLGSELSILFIAIQEGHFHIVEHLVALDKSCLNKNDKIIPLCLAASLNRIEILKLMLEQGADPTIKDMHGNTCYDCASPQGKLLIAKHFPPNFKQ